VILVPDPDLAPDPAGGPGAGAALGAGPGAGASPGVSPGAALGVSPRIRQERAGVNLAPEARAPERMEMTTAARVGHEARANLGRGQDQSLPTGRVEPLTKISADLWIVSLWFKNVLVFCQCVGVGEYIMRWKEDSKGQEYIMIVIIAEIIFLTTTCILTKKIWKETILL